MLEEQLTQYVHLMHGSALAGAGEATDGTCVRVEEDAGVRHQDDRAHLGYKGDGQCCYGFCLVITIGHGKQKQ